MPPNIRMEPTRPTVCAILSPRRAAHSARSAPCKEAFVTSDADGANNDARAPEVYSALCDRVNTEIGAFWQRNDVLLAVNVGLLALGLADITRGPFFMLLLATTGVVVALLWFLVVKRGRAWLYFWENKLADLEASMPGPHVFPAHWDERRDRLRQGEPRPVTTLLVPIPFLLSALWVILVVRTFLG